VRSSVTSGSLLTLRLGRRRFELFPLWPIVYLIGVAVVIVATIFIVERKVLPKLEKTGEVGTDEWEAHASRIAAQRAAILPQADPNPVWRSAGLPVSETRAKGHRILVLGDSFVYGTALVNINDVWWRQLQRELERRGYHDVEVIAAGREGASTRRELAFAKEVVPRYKPDLLIWGYVTNDPDEGLVSQTPTVPYPTTPRFNAAMAVVEKRLPLIAAHVRDLHRLKAEDRARHHGWYNYVDWELKLLEPANLAKYEGTLREVKQFMAEQHLPGFFAALPNYASATFFGPRYAPLEPLFAKVGLPFYNDLPEFVRTYGELPVLNFMALPTDAHPGPLSTHFHASKVADILERQYPGVLGAKTPPVPAAPRLNEWMPVSISLDRSEEARGVLTFDYPIEEWQMPLMPEKGTHVQLSLERPVALRQIHAEGPNLKNCEISYTAIGPGGYDDGRPKATSNGRCTLDLTGPSSQVVNSIHFSGSIIEGSGGTTINGRQRIKLTGPYTHRGGAAWIAQLPPSLTAVSDAAGITRSTLKLYEDQNQLGPPHTVHDEIGSVGHGSYSHWVAILVFSASDNSDPNTNGKQYEVDVENVTSHPRQVRLTIVPAGANP
jgi:hypothetical protein